VTEFAAETFQNEYLPEGGAEVNAIVTITSGNSAGSGPIRTELTEVILVDASGSMYGYRIQAAKQATKAAISALPDGVQFAVIAGTHLAHACFPSRGLAVADQHSRADAMHAVDQLVAEGGTAMSTWLDSAGHLFPTRPGAVNHAVLLTDGKNESEPTQALDAALQRWRGAFQCDCRGVGTDWVVAELRSIAAALLGTVNDVADPADLVTDFTAMINAAMGKANPDARLRVWTPVGATLKFVKQVAPEIADLTERRVDVNARSGDYPTGAWGAETRDYHVCVAVPPGTVGDELLAARVSLVTGDPDDETVAAKALVRAVWTDDSAQSTRINASVAHYTGQAELAAAIAEGLDARKAGDVDTATIKLGRAVQLAAASGHTETQALLEKVVDIEDSATGTVRLKPQVEKADEMSLDTRSTRTVRVGRST
jgi:von Willebrand factor type A C-terminal domain/von Willebrand factor type A domain